MTKVFEIPDMASSDYVGVPTLGHDPGTTQGTSQLEKVTGVHEKSGRDRRTLKWSNSIGLLDTQDLSREDTCVHRSAVESGLKHGPAGR